MKNNWNVAGENAVCNKFVKMSLQFMWKNNSVRGHFNEPRMSYQRFIK